MSYCAKSPLAGLCPPDPPRWAAGPVPVPHPANPAFARMSALAKLSAPETELLRALPGMARSYAMHAELCTEHQIQPTRILLSGWACQHRLLGDGRRQIISFLLPGDIIGSVLHTAMRADTSVVALTPVMAADGRPLMRAVQAAPASMPGLVSALLQIGHMDQARLLDHVVRLGRQTAYERLVHLLLEIHSRLDAIGQVEGDSFVFPLTQENLGDALGLSVVHINRTLQQIRRDRMVEIRGGRVTILQHGAMQAVAGWDPEVQMPRA